MRKAGDSENWGGAREGAGRPIGSVKLNFMKKMEIGARCEHLNREEVNSANKEKYKPLFMDLFAEYREAQSIPIDERAFFDHIDHTENVEDALKLVKNALSKESLLAEPSPSRSRNLRLKLTRPKGIRTNILDQVSSEFSLKRVQVDASWKFFRAIQKELNSEN